MITLAEVPKIKSGVYCLKLLGEVVYVGSSANVLLRVSSHNVKEFDAVDIHWCSEDVMRHEERIMIASLKPRLNGSKKARSSAGCRVGSMKSLGLTRTNDAKILNRFGKLVMKLRKVRQNDNYRPTDILREIILVRLHAEGL